MPDMSEKKAKQAIARIVKDSTRGKPNTYCTFFKINRELAREGYEIPKDLLGSYLDQMVGRRELKEESGSFMALRAYRSA